MSICFCCENNWNLIRLESPRPPQTYQDGHVQRDQLAFKTQPAALRWDHLSLGPHRGRGGIAKRLQLATLFETCTD